MKQENSFSTVMCSETKPQKHFCKKMLSVLLAFVMLFSISTSINLSAYATTSGDYRYELLDDGTVQITGYNGTAANLSIPSTIDGMKVTSIGYFAFGNCESLTNILIPNSVINIDSWAFYNCQSLTYITIPNSVTSIGDLVFDYCNNLENISVATDNKNYTSENGILYNKNKSELIKYPAAKTDTYFTIPNSVTSIATFAFQECYNLTSITIPNSVTSIDDLVFESCNNLENISVATDNENYTSENGILYNKNKSELIRYPAAKTSSSFTIPSSVTSIGNRALSDCISLASITIADGVTSIGYETFYNTAYYNNQSNWENGVLYIGEYLVDSDANIVPNNVTIKNGTVLIAKQAFYYCNNLENVTIPNSVTNIGEFAFGGCENLKSITIPNSVTSIGDYTFYFCEYLKNITIPNSVTNIGEFAFSGSDLLEDVYYSGTKAQWEKISVGNNNENLTEARIHCLDEIINCVHSYDNGKVTNAATCTANGVKTYTCTVCGATKTEAIEATGHKAVTDKAVAATCTKAGKTAGSHCSVCNAVITAQKTVAATGHIYDNGKITKAATCTATGTKKYTCTACGATKTETIKATGHKAVTDKAVAATCTKAGKTAGSHCSVCNAVITAQKTVSATGHTYDKGKVTKAATCTATGTKTYTCTKCKATKKETIKATGHSYKTTVTKATTKKNGSSVTKCTKCGNVSKKTTIYYPKTVTLSTTSYTYDGKVKKPGVTVKNSAGKTIAASNYTVTYPSGRKNVGTYTVKVTFKGNYSGSVSKTFKINPKNTSISSLSAQSKAFTVKLKKYTTQTTGYQIQYSTNSNFKNAKTVTVKNSTTSKKISKLSGKKKYYVRVRTYKTVGKTNYYSSWSKAKTVTTKK